MLKQLHVRNGVYQDHEGKRYRVIGKGESNDKQYIIYYQLFTYFADSIKFLLMPIEEFTEVLTVLVNKRKVKKVRFKFINK